MKCLKVLGMGRQLTQLSLGGRGSPGGLGALGGLGARGLHLSAARAQWRMTSHVVCTPPRVKVTHGEKLVHMAVMMIIWLGPVAWFHTQIKVWRREYGAEDK